MINIDQWRSEGIWRPGAHLNFAPPPPSKKFLKNDNIMSSIQLIMCIIILANLSITVISQSYSDTSNQVVCVIYVVS